MGFSESKQLEHYEELLALRDEKRSWEGAKEFGTHQWYRGIVEQRDRLERDLAKARELLADLRTDDRRGVIDVGDYFKEISDLLDGKE